MPRQTLLSEGLATPAQRQDYLQGRDDRVASSGVLGADDVSRILATENPPLIQHLGNHVTITHLGPAERNLARLKGELEPEVAHQGTDDSAGQAFAFLQIGRDDVEQLVTINDRTGMVDHHHPIAISVKGDPEISPMLHHRLLQLANMGGADIGIDVQPVRLRADHYNLGSQLAKYAGRYLVCSTMGAIDDQLEPGEVGTGRHAALAELDVATGRIVDPRCLAQLCRLDHSHRRIDQLLDHQLDLVGKLGSATGKELDAVVVMGIMRGADDDAGLGMEGTRQVSNRWRRHRPQQQHIGARSRQPRLQRRLEHVARNSGVLADQDAALALLAEGHACRPAQLEHKIRGNRRLPNMSANAVGAEILSSHDVFPTLPPALQRSFELRQPSRPHRAPARSAPPC